MPLIHVWTTPFHYLSFSASKMAFMAQKTLRFKRKMVSFEAKNTVKHGKNAKKTTGTYFTRVQGGGGTEIIRAAAMPF